MEEAQKEIPADQQILPNLEPAQNNGILEGLLYWLLPLGIVILVWVFLMRRLAGGSGGPGGQLFNIGKSKATLFDKESRSEERRVGEECVSTCRSRGSPDN